MAIEIVPEWMTNLDDESPKTVQTTKETTDGVVTF